MRGFILALLLGLATGTAAAQTPDTVLGLIEGNWKGSTVPGIGAPGPGNAILLSIGKDRLRFQGGDARILGVLAVDDSLFVKIERPIPTRRSQRGGMIPARMEADIWWFRLDSPNRMCSAAPIRTAEGPGAAPLPRSFMPLYCYQRIS